MAVTYQGKRKEDGDVAVTVTNTTATNTIGRTKKLRHVNYHSPDGFEWSYSGSGPADLALSILAHHLGETWVNGSYLRKLKLTQDAPLCWTFHLDFKRDVIARLAKDGWTLTNTDVHTWLMKQESAWRNYNQQNRLFLKR